MLGVGVAQTTFGERWQKTSYFIIIIRVGFI